MHRVHRHSPLAQQHAQAARPATPLPPTARPTPQRLPARPAPKRPAQRPAALCSMGSSPFQVLHTFFPFFFFHFFRSLENTKKYIIYFFSFSSTPINLLKFISSLLFLFSFPNNQINCLNLFYLISRSSLHIVNSKVCFPTCLYAIYLSTQTFTFHIQHVIHTKHIHTTIHQST